MYFQETRKSRNLGAARGKQKMSKSKIENYKVEAMDQAIREDNYIFYGTEKPLYLSLSCQILCIMIVNDEEDENNEKSQYDKNKIIRVYFLDDCSGEMIYTFDQLMEEEKPPMFSEYHTTKSLEEFEKALLDCKDESDIESLDEYSNI